MAMQYGGWYDNPATGRNQRWFNGVWTDGPEPGGGGGGALDTFNQYKNQISGEVNKYVDELIGKAQGDYDFAAKWIENNYKLALGTDDTARQAFLKEVSNSLESKVGRIAFDYNTGTYRLNQDADTQTTRTTRDTSQALSRLAEDEQVFKRDFARQSAQERAQQEATLNERGILSTPRDQATGLAGKEVRDLNTEQENTMAAYERALGRQRSDINRASSDTLFDIGLGRTRGLEDLTTQARRGATDQQNEYDYNTEAAKRQLAAQKLEAERQRRALLNQSNQYADYFARGATNTF